MNLDKFITYYFKASLLILILVSGYKIIFSHDLSLKNDELSSVLIQRTEIAKELEDLKFQSYELSSMQRIESRAKQLGFEHVSTKVTVLELTTGSKVAALSTN